MATKKKSYREGLAGPKDPGSVLGGQKQKSKKNGKADRVSGGPRSSGSVTGPARSSKKKR